MFLDELIYKTWLLLSSIHDLTHSQFNGFSDASENPWCFTFSY